MSDINTGGSACHDGDDAPTHTLATATGALAPAPVPELTGVGAGIVGAALVTAGVWGLHVLTRGEGVAASAGWAVLLLAAFTALGKGITLLRRALTPLSAVLSASVAGVPAPVRAVAGITVGAAGMWWVMRGHANTWWALITGVGDEWILLSRLAAVVIIAIAGALLFGGGKALASLIFSNSGTRQHNRDTAEHAGAERWSSWWSSHPGLGLSLLAGGAALVFLSGYVVPRVSGWLTGDDPMAALAAVAAILTLALLANTWWWHALSGWWTWAHTPNGPGGPTPIGQMYAGAGVLALIMFSATAFGLASLSSYLPHTAAVASAAPCPPDCGGGGGSDQPPNGGQQFRPPDMPAQQPDYQGGFNQAPLDQNSGISIYNPSSGQAGPQQAPQNMGPQMPGQRAAHGEPLPNYGPWQPDAQPPAQGPVQQAPQVPQQPAQAPQSPAGQQPVQQAPQQPVQQVPQQPGAQQPQGQPGQQPAQQNPPQPGQNQTGQTQPGQEQPQKEPDVPKKNPMDPTDLASAATRRGSQQAGQQAGQQAAQQGTQQATQQAPKSTAQTQQAPQTTQQSQQTPKPSQQTQQSPKQTKQIQGRPKGAPEEQPWDVTGEIKPINEQFPNGGQKVGMEGRLGIQNKDPIALGETNVGEYNLSSTIQQKFGIEGETSVLVDPKNPQAAAPKAEVFGGYNFQNDNLINGPGVTGKLTSTFKAGPSLSKGATTNTPIGAGTVIQNLGDGKYYINLPVSASWRWIEGAGTFQGVVDVPRIAQGLKDAGMWIISGPQSLFGP